MRKAGSVEIWFGGETDHLHCGGEGALVAERGEREWSTQGYAQG